MEVKQSFLIVLLIKISLVETAVQLAPPKPAFNAELMRKTNYGKWLSKRCPHYSNLNKMKQVVNTRITKRMKKISENNELEASLRKAQIDTLLIFIKELNETESLVEDSFKWMEDIMKGDYNDFSRLKESSMNRLEALRSATLREEQEVNMLLKAEIYLSSSHNHTVKGIMEDILAEVAEAADMLEDTLDDHVFDNAVNNADQAKPNIQAVIKLDESHEEANTAHNDTETADGEKEHAGGEVIKLVDAQDNQFVMSKGADSTIPHEDHRLILDVVYVLLLCCVCGWLCALVALPTMFGYIVAGVIMGPSGFGILKSLVQLETLGEFGVFLILFSVGLEFSPANLRKVFRVATLGTALMTGLMVLCGVAVGWLLSSTAAESCFVAACISLSSTPLVVKFLNPTSDDPADSPSTTDYGTVLLGILVTQDVFLGVLIAILPNMAAHTSASASGEFLIYFHVAMKLIAALIAVLLLAFILAYFLLPRLYRHLLRRGNNEVTVLATVAIAFSMLLVTSWLSVSMELGCFVAGVMVSAQGHAVVDAAEALISPVKDFLACIFFASIGLHVFPTFLIYELTILTTFTMAAVGAKYIISVCVLYVLVPRHHAHIKWIVSAGLAQVSEFSFVLGSRARQLGLISREVYLLILSVTTCSLICAPILWKLTLYNLNIRQNPSLKISASSVNIHGSPNLRNVDEESAVENEVLKSSTKTVTKHRRHMDSV